MKKASPSAPSSSAAGAASVSYALPLNVLGFGQGADHLAAFRWLAAPLPVTWTLTEQIASKVGDRILSDELPSGAWLREQDYADEFGVSRGPIRDAFQILQREGLVHLHARRGAQVSVLSAREVRDIFQIRANLFRLVARLLAEQREPAYVAALEAATARLEALAQSERGGDEYAQTVFRLSLYSAAACGNERLRDILTSLSLQTFRYSRLGLQPVERRKRSLKLWKATLAAIKAGDPDGAEEVAARRIAENGAAAEHLLSIVTVKKRKGAQTPN
ncbi:MAG TPA: GntR family transcriptional regulator [Burkholderiales bacterium]|nr:GntR family transcriptional regulator [Burkholderiales bacterium]